MYPLPAATVYATCARFLNLAKPIRKVEIGPGVTAYVFDRNEEAEGVAAIWSNAEARKLAFDAGGVVRVFTGFGQPAGSGSKPSISLGKTPTFLTFALKDLDRVVKGLRGGTVSGGRPVEVNHAYFPSERVLTLCVMNHKNRDTPIEIRIAARKETQILPPGESKVTIQLSAPAGKSVDAVVTADGTGRKVSVPADFHPVHRLAKVAVDGRLAETAGLTEIMLDRRRDVLPPDPTIPWKSPADLSVRVWVGWTDEGLYFAARVCDPVHFAPPAQAEDFWSFDSIQLAIDVRGDSTAGFGPDDLELGLGSAKDGAALYRTWPLPMRPTAGRAVIRRDGTDTVYETLIPWKELGISSPARGKVFPFNFAVNQNNGTGRLYWMGLRPGICESKDPTVYRKFVLK